MVPPVYVYLSKILPLFVMPVSVVLILLLLAFLFLQRDWKSTGVSLVLAAVVILWMSSTPLVATTLYRDLEARYPPLPLAKLPVGDCLVLLGGAVGPAMPPRVDIELGEAVDRVYKAAQVQRAGRAKFVIVTAGNQPWSESPWAEADLLRDLLMEWGVPKDAIFLEGSSRNTRENALYSKIMIDSMQLRHDPAGDLGGAHAARGGGLPERGRQRGGGVHRRAGGRGRARCPPWRCCPAPAHWP